MGFDSDNFYIKIELDNIISVGPNKLNTKETDKAYIKLKELSAQIPENIFLQDMLKYYKPHDEKVHKSDDDVYHEYLMERYGR